MQLIGLQLDIVWEDKAANFAKVRELAAAAKPEPGALLVLPEMFSTGFSMNVAGIHESPARETETFLSELAKTTRCFVLGGLVVKQEDGRGRNEAAAFGPDGSPLARYAKIHPFSYGGETQHYAPGTEIVRFDWNGVAVTPFICYDLRFPEIFRAAVKGGTQLYAVIANWPEPREAHWLALLRARAIENQAYVIGVNRCGSDPKLRYSGRGQIVDPRGVVIADGANAPGFFSAEVDLAGLLTYRKEFPALQDMK